MQNPHRVNRAESIVKQMAKINFDELNSTIRYVMYSAFSISSPLPTDRTEIIQDALEWEKNLSEDITIRGFYDITGMRADTDYLIWWHAETIEELQEAFRSWRRDTQIGQASTCSWSATALHRPAEFNKSHIPAFLKNEPAGKYVCIYPFVRSYEWYLLPDEERRAMLADHGMAAREYQDVRANTISSFALGDYEWILAFEAPELYRIVDLMRHLRATEARLHVREEVPFFTGPRVDITHICQL